MPRARIPSYRLHKPSGQAVVTVRTTTGERRDVYLGEYDSPESRREYARVVAELATSPTATAVPTGVGGPGLTIDQVLLAFWEHARRHYRTPTGKPTTEVEESDLDRSTIRASNSITFSWRRFSGREYVSSWRRTARIMALS
jgi:hypothetical protein